MDMQILREWLIRQGIPAEELDGISELPVLRDVGDALVLLLLNSDNLGNALVTVMQQNEQLAVRINELKTELEAMKNA